MPIRAVGLPRSRDRKPGVVKMPPPMTLAMTTLVAVRSPTLRASPRTWEGDDGILTDMYSLVYPNPVVASTGSLHILLFLRSGGGEAVSMRYAGSRIRGAMAGREPIRSSFEEAKREMAFCSI